MINSEKLSQEQDRLISLSHLSLICISGEGAARFLQGQLTCNVDEITSNQSRLGAHCNPQGRIISLFRLFYSNNHYYIQVPSDTLELTLSALKKYAVFFKVALSEAAGKACLSYSGPNARNALSSYFSTLPANVDEVTQIDEILIIRAPGFFPHYQLIGNADSLAIMQKQLANQSILSDVTYWKIINISAGIPVIYAATSGTLLPHEINLPQINAVSFNKGCYTGQEIIARMHYRGHLKKHMYRFLVTTTLLPAPGNAIYHFDGNPGGTIVESAQIDSNNWQLLAIANQTDVESKQLFLDPHKKELLECLKLPYEQG